MVMFLLEDHLYIILAINYGVMMLFVTFLISGPGNDQSTIVRLLGV